MYSIKGTHCYMNTLGKQMDGSTDRLAFEQMNHQLQQTEKTLLLLLIIAILSKACEPDIFKLHNSPMLIFTSIQGLCSDFVDWESFLESNSPEILALCETNQDNLIDSGKFSVGGYLPLIRKDSGTRMHSLAVNVKEELPFAQDLSLENSAVSYLFLTGLLHTVSFFFFLY